MGVKDSLLGRFLGNVANFSDQQVVQTIDMLVQNGARAGATAIHIEPQGQFALVRYRVGGVLRSVHKLPIGALPALAHQIKKMANLSANEMRTWQEGKWCVLVGSETYDVRATVMPVFGGEKAVLHLARQVRKPLSLEQIGFWGQSLHYLHTTLSRPRGLVLVAAPKNSGKRTTMHAMINMLQSPAISVATVEEAANQQLTGVTQSRVRPHAGLAYRDMLEATLAQDANVVAVANLPDRATTDTAVRAAASGHLIIAGLYADNAASGITHACALCEEPYLLATSLSAAVSQRLVRRLCQHCREQYALNPTEVTELEKSFGINSATTRRRIHELENAAVLAGVGNTKTPCTTPNHITHLWRASEDGCDKCNFTGYDGLIAACEVLPVTDEIRAAVLSQTATPKLRDLALKSGFVPLGLDGLIKALRGQTTIEEVLRVL